MTTESQSRRVNYCIVLGLLATWGLACGGGTPDPSTTIVDIKAEARFSGTQFIVGNLENREWFDVKLEINKPGMFSDGYMYRLPALAGGQALSVGALQFAKPDGTRFNPFQVKPQKVSITVRLPDGKTGLYLGGWQ